MRSSGSGIPLRCGILDRLRERGTKILNSFEPKPEEMEIHDYRRGRVRTMKEATVCNAFLTGSNALTEDGRLVNVDAVGNRVAGMFWGHPLSILVVGRNKIVRDLDEAFERKNAGNALCRNRKMQRLPLRRQRVQHLYHH
jgi:hypothetical protein